MASEHPGTTAGGGQENGPSAETNEHDYAHTAVGGFALPEASSSSSGTPGADGTVVPQETFNVTPPELMVELPDPVVGAEVDCPGGSDVVASTQPGEEPRGPAVPATVMGIAPSAGSRGGRRRAKRPEDKTCSGCGVEFERQGRSFNRRAVFTFSTPDTVQWVFPEASVHDKSFLCETCAQVIRTKCKRKQSGKRFLWLKPPIKKQVSFKTTCSSLHLHWRACMNVFLWCL